MICTWNAGFSDLLFSSYPKWMPCLFIMWEASSMRHLRELQRMSYMVFLVNEMWMNCIHPRKLTWNIMEPKINPFFQRNIIFQTFNFGFKILIVQGAGWFSHHKNLLLSSSPNGTSRQQLLGMWHPKPPRMSVKASYTRVILVESRNNDLANGFMTFQGCLNLDRFHNPMGKKKHVVPGKFNGVSCGGFGARIRKILRWWYLFQ